MHHYRGGGKKWSNISGLSLVFHCQAACLVRSFSLDGTWPKWTCPPTQQETSDCTKLIIHRDWRRHTLHTTSTSAVLVNCQDSQWHWWTKGLYHDTKQSSLPSMIRIAVRDLKEKPLAKKTNQGPWESCGMADQSSPSLVEAIQTIRSTGASPLFHACIWAGIYVLPRTWYSCWAK